MNKLLTGFLLIAAALALPACDNKNQIFTQLCDAQGFRDSDGDGFGTGELTDACEGGEVAPGYVENADDCNDSNGDVNPSALEICDGIDNDCDGDIDDDDEVAEHDDSTLQYEDADGDGFGNEENYRWACQSLEGHVPLPDDVTDFDCDDTDASINPGESEVCDGIDNDCDGDIDSDDNDVSGEDVTLQYADNDGDTYGGYNATAIASCDGVQPGFSADNQDCDDTDASINPGADDGEYPDGDDDGRQECRDSQDLDVDSTFQDDIRVVHDNGLLCQALGSTLIGSESSYTDSSANPEDTTYVWNNDQLLVDPSLDVNGDGSNDSPAVGIMWPSIGVTANNVLTASLAPGDRTKFISILLSDYSGELDGEFIVVTVTDPASWYSSWHTGLVVSVVTATGDGFSVDPIDGATIPVNPVDYVDFTDPASTTFTTFSVQVNGDAIEASWGGDTTSTTHPDGQIFSVYHSGIVICDGGGSIDSFGISG